MSKTEADDLKKIAMSWLKKHGYLQGWCSATITWTNGFTGAKSSIGLAIATLEAEQYARFTYTQTNDDGEKKDYDYKVPLVTTPCRFGGKRYWFQCPFSHDGQYCGRRVGVLYKAGEYFACRHCYNLTYYSRNANHRVYYYPLFHTIDLQKKIEEVERTIKRPYYAGKPTRKQRRLNHLYQQAMISYARSTQPTARKLL